MDSALAPALRFRDIFFGCLDASYETTELQELIEKGRHYLLACLERFAGVSLDLLPFSFSGNRGATKGPFANWRIPE